MGGSGNGKFEAHCAREDCRLELPTSGLVCTGTRLMRRDIHPKSLIESRSLSQEQAMCWRRWQATAVRRAGPLNPPCSSLSPEHDLTVNHSLTCSQNVAFTERYDANVRSGASKGAMHLPATAGSFRGGGAALALHRTILVVPGWHSAEECDDGIPGMVTPIRSVSRR